MTMPRHRVLDLVEIRDRPAFRAEGSAGLTGVVVRVRLLDNSEFRYEVASLVREQDDVVPGVYGEADLVPTGTHVQVVDAGSLQSATPLPLGRRGESVNVSAAGHMLGVIGYTIIDDIDHHH